MWKIVYAISIAFSIIATFFLWQEGYLGLNIYGVCADTFLRIPNASIGIPISLIAQNIVFLGVGIFTIRYFKKHYPDSIGLRSRRRYQKQVLILYVVGYSFFWNS